MLKAGFRLDVCKVQGHIVQETLVQMKSDLALTNGADVIKAYGENYKENGTALVYEKDGMKLSFIMDGDHISSIQYSSSVMD